MAALLPGGLVRRIMAAAVIATSLWIEPAFVIGGQMASLGPMATGFGPMQGYLPNLPEVAIFILGISVAPALIRLDGRCSRTVPPHSHPR